MQWNWGLITDKGLWLLLQDTVNELFDGGSSFGLKDVLTVKNQRRVIDFYHT